MVSDTKNKIRIDRNQMRAFQEHQNRGDDAVQNSRQKNDLLEFTG